MNSETKNCQNCKKDFTIEPDDFGFYEKIKVPPPTFCPECRLIRRMMFRNEISFYRRVCELCQKNIISIFSSEKNLRVFCSECWWSDKWDSGEYYLDYDPHINFFEQLKKLQEKTPFMDKITSYTTLLNSEYVNHAGHLKNCYLVFNAEFCENVYYSATIDHVRDSLDCLMMNNSELSYECIGGDGSRLFFSENCSECINVWYSKDCHGCNDCFGCVNLIKKSYYIFNQPYTKEEFKKKIEEMQLDKNSSHMEIQKEVYEFWNKFPRKYMYGRMNKNSTGDYVFNSKNAKNCYQVTSVEDSSFCQLITTPAFRDSYDITEWGNGVERCIDGITVGDGAYEVKYSSSVWNNVRDVEYSMYVNNCKNCFGCVNLRKKQFCILNKQYTQEEYFKIREKIIKDLETNPYVDIQGRIWKYGDFFPYDLSPFSYNESFANQYFPMEKDEIKKFGFTYLESSKTGYNATLNIKDVPDSIHNIIDDFISEILECNCGKFYQIKKGELILLRKFNLPIPRECPDCRYLKRIKKINHPMFFNRNCVKCGKSIQTSYFPDRPEIVYCEKCYQQEVY